MEEESNVQAEVQKKKNEAERSLQGKGDICSQKKLKKKDKAEVQAGC